MPVCTKQCMKWGFGYGESECEVSFGLAPRNGELSHSVPETPEPFNLPFRDRNPERSAESNSSQSFGLGTSPRDKRSIVQLLMYFLKMANVEIKFFYLSQLCETELFTRSKLAVKVCSLLRPKICRHNEAANCGPSSHVPSILLYAAFISCTLLMYLPFIK